MMTERPPYGAAGELTDGDRQRYSRHLSLPQFGTAGQLKLKAAKVLIVGLGGLGSPAALYLAAAGVGQIGLWDFDEVEASNLQRQILYAEADIGQSKAQRAAVRIQALNSEVHCVVYDTPLDRATAAQCWQDYDLILDGTDNDAAHYLINDLCCYYKRPLLAAAVFQFEGRLSLFVAGDAPCFRCLYPSPPPAAMGTTCNEAGVLGVVPGTLGLLQATEALKFLTGLGSSLAGRYLIFDALAMSFREWKVGRRKDCPACAPHATLPPLLAAPEPLNERAFTIDAAQFEALRCQAGSLLIDVRQVEEAHSQGAIPGHLALPLPELATKGLALPHDRLLLLYCAKGQRSSQAAHWLLQHGFSQVKSLQGGIEKWHAYKRAEGQGNDEMRS